MNDLIDEIYIINMDNEIQRLRTFDHMMTSEHDTDQSWKYVRMPAINGRNLQKGIDTVYRVDEDTLDLINCESTLQVTDISLLKQRYMSEFHWLSPSEVGCLLSHVYLWEQLVKNPYFERIIIFEDDARTHNDIITVQKLIQDFYQYIVANNIEEPDMLYLGKALDSCMKYERVWMNVYKSHHPLCLHAYIITKKGARKLLEKGPYNVAIDLVPIHEIAKKNIQVMTFHPSIYFQDVINNESGLRGWGAVLNITTECLVDQQHISDNDIKYLGAVLIGFISALILYILYTFVWVK